MSSLGKDNKKRRTYDNNMSIATTSKTPKRVQTTDKLRDTPLPEYNMPTHQIVKEGRVSGYPIIVKQVG